MKKYQQRVIEERRELFVKIAKLANFLAEEKFDQLSKDDIGLLRTQHVAMLGYYSILKTRIANFK